MCSRLTKTCIYQWSWHYGIKTTMECIPVVLMSSLPHKMCQTSPHAHMSDIFNPAGGRLNRFSVFPSSHHPSPHSLSHVCSLETWRVGFNPRAASVLSQIASRRPKGVSVAAWSVLWKGLLSVNLLNLPAFKPCNKPLIMRSACHVLARCFNISTETLITDR